MKKNTFDKNLRYDGKEVEPKYETLKGKALWFATKAHEGQFRKFTKAHEEPIPYITHPIAVAKLVEEYGGSNLMIVAALLHDTVEDCDVSIIDITKEFGAMVALYVDMLTDEYTHKKYPELNREVRKNCENTRMLGACEEAKIIKLADLVDNTKSITNDPHFAKIYFKEKADMLAIGLKSVNKHPLYELAKQSIEK